MAKAPKAKGAATVISGGTDTVKAVFSNPAMAAGGEGFTPGWDRRTGYAQPQARSDQRRAMGKKMTPIGRGTLIKKG